MKNPDEPKKTPNEDISHAEKTAEVRPADYLRAVRVQLKNGRQKDAFKVLQQASVQFPDDAVVLSYYGCLQAVVDKKYRSGVETCKKAIAMLQQKEMFEEEVLYPVFYLNLGRAYLAAGKKQDAIDAFYDGLQYDSGNSELKKELRGLGTRKQPPVPFLDRSNPINKYIGLLLHKPQRAPEKARGKATRR